MRLIDIEDEILKKNLFMKQLEGGLSAKRAIRLFMNQPTVEAIPIDYIENWLKELRKSLRNVQMSIPTYNDTMNKLYEFEIVIHTMIYDWRKENERNNL